MNLVESIKRIQRHYGAEVDGKFGPETAQAVLRGMAAEAGGTQDGIPPVIDERTYDNLQTLDPKARQRFRDFTLLAKATAASYGCEYVCICGHRSWEEQDALYAKGPKVTRAKGGYSNHNFAIAADYGVFRGKAYLDETDPMTAEKVHRACAMHAVECGLEWGGDWKSFKDVPHYEVATGLTMAQKRRIYQEKGSVL